jgi:cation diffusion facilitator family transporter
MSDVRCQIADSRYRISDTSYLRAEYRISDIECPDVSARDSHRRDSALRLAWVAVAAGLVVLGIKYAAYRVTGSVSLYSDALETIVNLVAGVGVLIAIRVAAQPPDRNHPFGHTKAEYFSAVLEGALILYAAVEIIRVAWARFGDPLALERIETGLGLALLATGINAVMAFVLVRSGRRLRSPALYSDGQHLWADVLTTVSVLVGISLAWATGWWLLDPLLAVAIAGHVLWTGFTVVRDSVGGLMDMSLPEGDMRLIRAAISENLGKALEVHDLRSRLAGGRPFVEFHLVVPADMTVQESHDICDRLEDSVRKVIATASVLIHVEPEEKAKQEGRVAQIR